MKFNFIRFMREPSVTEAIADLGKTVKEGIAEAKQKANDVANSHDALKKQLDALNDGTKEEFKKWREAEDARFKEMQETNDKLQGQIKLLNQNGLKIQQPGQGLDFISACAKAIGENYDKIATVSKKGIDFQLEKGAHMYKATGANMTTPTSLTGSPNITYIPTPVILPRQLINFRDLVPMFQSTTGLINLFRENVVGGNPNTTPQVGNIGQQLTQGATKNQVEYQFTNVPFNADYIAGFVRISKQMLQDLLFLQTYLPQMLLRDYYKAENSIFQDAQASASFGSTTTSGGNDAEKFIDYITNLEATNFAPNAIVTTPSVWGTIMKTTVPSIGTSYSVPGGFYINPRTGDVEIAGIPILKATWMPSGSAFIADWSQSQVAVVDGLKVEFFEQDDRNVQQNLITVRVECRCVLVTAQPYAFSYATGL